MQRMELYFMAHPGSPSAVRRPRLSLRGGVWTALLGSNRRNGITGFGTTVEEALGDFDISYLRALRPPEASNKTANTESFAHSGLQAGGTAACL